MALSTAELRQPSSRWANHVAELHRAERASAAHQYSGAPVPPAQFTVRRLQTAPTASSLLKSRRSPVQLELFPKGRERAT